MEPKPMRKPNRLQDYDYSKNGAYFVTICTQNRRCLFWKENEGAIINRPPISVPLNEKGRIVERAILDIEQHYPGVTVVKYVVMPNHVHLMLLFDQYDMLGVSKSGRAMLAPTGADIDGGRSVIAPTEIRKPTTLSNVIRHMKGAATKALGEAVWQKSFHDHILRTEADLLEIWNYIDQNPIQWETDEFYNPKQEAPYV